MLQHCHWVGVIIQQRSRPTSQATSKKWKISSKHQ